jgi:Flp pilus assembly protein TadG
MNPTCTNNPSPGLSRARACFALVRRAGLRDAQGAAMVEFVLVLPVLLLCVFTIAQGSLALNSANDETHVANEVARYATINENPGGSESLQAWGRKQLDQNALKTGAKVCITFPSGASLGNPVRVEVTSTTSWFPVLKLGVASTKVTGIAYMRLERPPTTFSEGCA